MVVWWGQRWPHACSQVCMYVRIAMIAFFSPFPSLSVCVPTHLSSVETDSGVGQRTWGQRDRHRNGPCCKPGRSWSGTDRREDRSERVHGKAIETDMFCVYVYVNVMNAVMYKACMYVWLHVCLYCSDCVVLSVCFSISVVLC